VNDVRPSLVLGVVPAPQGGDDLTAFRAQFAKVVEHSAQQALWRQVAVEYRLQEVDVEMTHWLSGSSCWLPLIL
jgi:hypothetical protein